MIFKKKLLLEVSLYDTKYPCKGPKLKSLLNKAVDSQACNVIKKRLQHRCFPVNSAKFSRTPFLQNTSAHLLPQWHFFHISQNLIQFYAITLVEKIWNFLIFIKFFFGQNWNGAFLSVIKTVFESCCRIWKWPKA